MFFSPQSVVQGHYPDLDPYGNSGGRIRGWISIYCVLLNTLVLLFFIPEFFTFAYIFHLTSADHQQCCSFYLITQGLEELSNFLFWCRCGSRSGNPTLKLGQVNNWQTLLITSGYADFLPSKRCRIRSWFRNSTKWCWSIRLGSSPNTGPVKCKQMALAVDM